MFLQFNTGNSYWPIFIGVFLLNLFLTFLNYVNFINKYLLNISIISVLLTLYLWYKDIFRESHYLGAYNIYIQNCFKLGMLFFILREFIFFFSFFWSYFHFMFMCQGEFSFNWPPLIVDKVNYLRLPLFNTLLLLIRGLTLTIAHRTSLSNTTFKTRNYLVLTVLLGLIFTFCQIWEFYMLTYLISSSCYGSIFFIGTGFHGRHVILGTFILSITYIISKKNMLFNNNVFFEMGAWYWHFVDVIWLFLFREFYWWINFF